MIDAAMTPLEACRAAFRAQLDRDVANDEDLYALGGDSLALLLIVLEVEETLGIAELPDRVLRGLGERCSVAGLAAVVAGEMGR